MTRLDSVKASLRQRTARVTGQKDIILVVHFVLECEGRRAKGRMVDSQKGLAWKGWMPSTEVVRAAVLSAVYGTTNVKNDPMSNTAQHIEWESRRIQRAIAQKVGRHMETKKAKETLSRAGRSERRKSMLGAMKEVLKKFPEMRKQDFLLAFQEAKKEQVVREVMET